MRILVKATLLDDGNVSLLNRTLPDELAVYAAAKRVPVPSTRVSIFPATGVCSTGPGSADICNMRVTSVLLFFVVSSVVGTAESQKTGVAARTTSAPQVKDAGISAKPLLTTDQVQGWIAKWQKRLALEDWQIDAKIVRVWELPDNAVANIHWSLPSKKATVRVMNSLDSNLPKSEIVKDTELSVVHELVHLSMAKLPLDPNHTELEEEAVKKLSMALLALEDQN